MQYSSRELIWLGTISCAAWGLVPTVFADEMRAERISSTANTSLTEQDSMSLDIVIVDVDLSADGKVVTLNVRSRYETRKNHVAADGKLYWVERLIRERKAVLPSRDWQRALDRHLGKVRVTCGGNSPVLTFCGDGPLQGTSRTEILDIVKRRGFIFDPDPPRQTGYLPPSHSVP